MSKGLTMSTIIPELKSKINTAQTEIFCKCLKFEDFDIRKLTLTTVSDGIYYIDNVLDNDELRMLKENIEFCNVLSFWNPKGPQEELKQYRNANTIEISCEKMIAIIWERIHHLLTGMDIVVTENDNDPNYERDLVGNWQIESLNHDILLAKYPLMGAFSPHTDGRAIHSFNKRSFYSVILFLNTIPHHLGGGTRFYPFSALNELYLKTEHDSSYWTTNSKFILADVASVEGRFLFFHQSLVHEGVPCSSPSHVKYILRSDIMYTRNPPICNEPNDVMAYKLFQEGELLAEVGKVSEAIRLFDQSFKLSPSLSVIMGQK